MISKLIFMILEVYQWFKSLLSNIKGSFGFDIDNFSQSTFGSIFTAQTESPMTSTSFGSSRIRFKPGRFPFAIPYSQSYSYSTPVASRVYLLLLILKLPSQNPRPQNSPNPNALLLPLGFTISHPIPLVPTAMPQNDDVRFTSSSLKVLLPPQPSPFKFPFCSRTIASQMAKTRNSLAQLIDSVKTRSDFKRFSPGFSHLLNRFTELTHSDSRPGNVCGGVGLLIGKSSLLCSSSLSLIRSDESTPGTQKSGSRSQYGKEEEQRQLVPKSSLLCSASLALTRPDELATQGDSSGREAQSKGHSSSRVHDEERVLISEVLVRNKDGEELERKDLEMEALQALKACRANSALTVSEVQEDVHRIIHSGYFFSCMPVAVDTRDGIRLVFQV